MTAPPLKSRGVFYPKHSVILKINFLRSMSGKVECSIAVIKLLSKRITAN